MWFLSSLFDLYANEDCDDGNLNNIDDNIQNDSDDNDGNNGKLYYDDENSDYWCS